jgi:hypothetical protein
MTWCLINVCDGDMPQQAKIMQAKANQLIVKGGCMIYMKTLQKVGLKPTTENKRKNNKLNDSGFVGVVFTV